MARSSAHPLRIALYSHDTMGLGHARRNGLIASALAAPPLHAEVLLITGAREAGTFPLPGGVDCITLPAYRKSLDGSYAARSLLRETASLVRLRSQLIEAALDELEPDIFIVDNVPRGALAELDPVLEGLRRRNRTRCVLGLRDILDEPAAVRRQWNELDNEAVVERYFDAVWVYGDVRVNDVATAYGFGPSTRARLSHVGYLDQRRRLAAAPALPTPPNTILCCIGGGQDGAALARAFLEAELPAGRRGCLLTGPYLPPDVRHDLEQTVGERPGFTVLPFSTEPIRHIAQAERVITMGGYNTVNEILSLDRPGLVVPRVQPRQEQRLRAEKLAGLGLVDWVHPDALDGQAISAWLARLLPIRPAARALLDFGALDRLPGLIEALLPCTARHAAIVATTSQGAEHVHNPHAA